MTQAPPRSGQVLGLSAGGFHRIAFHDWGPERDGEGMVSGRPVLCLHGLTRNGRDFDALAAALAATGRRAVAPDVVGRGRSDWLADPAGYGYPQYLADMAPIIARLDAATVDWVGTSMGGLIGMMLAAQPNSPIARLVINDVGPFIPKAAIERIGTYVGQAPHFADLEALEAYLRRVHAPFGPLSDAQWRHLATHSARPDGEGFRLAYDPGIAEAFKAALDDVDLWSLWDRIAVPVLVLRGAQSDLLSPETAAEMAARGPKAQVVEISGCGHAPMLMDPAQIAIVRDWLVAGAP